MSAPVPGAVAVYAVAWGEHHDPPQGAGWVLPDGSFVPESWYEQQWKQERDDDG